MQLRIKDVDIQQRQLTIREGKGGKDRLAILPDGVIDAIRRQIKAVSRMHSDDLQREFGRTTMSPALIRKWPQVDRVLGWQYVVFEPCSGSRRRNTKIRKRGLYGPRPEARGSKTWANQ